MSRGLLKKHSFLFNNQAMFLVILGLMISLLIDTTFIKLYDVVSKNTLSIETRVIVFSINISVSLILQLVLLKYAKELTANQLGTKTSFRPFSRFAQLSYYWLILLISFLIFQLFYFSYYNSYVLMLIVLTTYGVSSVLIGKISMLFVSWYKTNHDFIVLMYFISMALIVFNLILTSLVVNIHLIDRPEKLRQFSGGSMDLSAGKYDFLALIHKTSSVLSFASIWLTTVVLTYSSRDKLIIKIRYWAMPVILLVYFLISYFAQNILNPVLVPLLKSDPILLSLSLIMIFTLIKPIGGIMFGVAFWNMSRFVRYEKTLRDYLIISGYGFLLLFSANQSTSLVLGPYPPFGTSTITILMVSSYLIMIGIYNSAALISKNINLRKSIQKIAKESKLLSLIGRAEMEKEINKTVTKIMQQTGAAEEPNEASYELDEGELKSYLGTVIDELKKNEVK
jgi:hypothetical protein